MQEEITEISGIIERITYSNEENGYAVLRLRLGSGQMATVVGRLDMRRPGEYLCANGKWIFNPQYGRQFEAESYSIGAPPDNDSLMRYLASDVIDGIGQEMARRLVEHFGGDFMRIVREEPQRLTEVEGIGRKRATQIRKSLLSEDREQRALRELSTRLMGFGIGPAKIRKIYRAYRDAALDYLHRDPYRLIDEIDGFGFTTADMIASRMNVAPDSPSRLKAGLVYVLENASGEGNCYLEKSELLEQAKKLLAVEGAKIENAFVKLADSQAVVEENGRVYIARFFDLECSVANVIVEFLRAKGRSLPIGTIRRGLENVQKECDIEFTHEQRGAVENILSENQIQILTGGPGTGKTTIIRAVAKIADANRWNIALCAPTGRAAQRLSEAVDMPAYTIHRLLNFRPDQISELAVRKLNVDLIVIDEMSMVDLELFSVVLSALDSGCKILLVGDSDQLPSVGPGRILGDLIDSAAVPVVKLSLIHRQAVKSRIIAESHNIIRGLVPSIRNNPGSDFFFLCEEDRELGLQTVIDLVSHRLPTKYGFDSKRDIQVIVPMYKGVCGANELNKGIREILNRGSLNDPEVHFLAGDKVMQIKNNYDLGVFNGDIGIVASVNREEEEIHVDFGRSGIASYSREDLAQLTLAYAITVHKSQGSEVPCVVIPLYTEHFMLLRRKLLYTAITRAKELCVIVGQPRALELAVQRSIEDHRNTGLAERLRKKIAHRNEIPELY
jgi:exodeoxyribonuclease V alpha subunit